MTGRDVISGFPTKRSESLPKTHISTSRLLRISFFLFAIGGLHAVVSGQTNLTKNEIAQIRIDSFFAVAEKQGLNTSHPLKYTYTFIDGARVPLIELGSQLVGDSMEVIEVIQQGDNWQLRVFETKAHSRASMLEREKMLKWQVFKYKLEDYLGFKIAKADINMELIPSDKFIASLKALDNDDLFNVAMRFDKLNHIDKALVAFQELTLRGFKSDTSYYKMGSALIATHEYVEGIKHWERSIEINPQYREVHMRLGEIYFENSHWKKAYSNYKQADRLKPNDDVILYNLSKSLMKLERYNEAYATINRALKINNKNVFAKGVLKSLKHPKIKKLRKKYPEM